ncbi:glycosyltransferase, partial [bacterium]|nr:glycosyltransferase [candidate division CSSED10-310 bacterium]
VVPFLRSIDLLAMPSHKEGFSNALLEALACGVPVVVTDVGGNAEAVRDGVEGFVVPAGDQHSFQEAVLRMIKTPELRVTMARQARTRANHFSLEAMVKKTEKLYSDLTCRKLVNGPDLVYNN